jgi:hypothetical protein
MPLPEGGYLPAGLKAPVSGSELPELSWPARTQGHRSREPSHLPVVKVMR